jgi:hypothetical protein
LCEYLSIFKVDYYSGNHATVEFYKNLPSYGYNLIVFRVHISYHYAYKNTSKAYIGWNGPISADHTDKATIRFLKHFLIERQTIAKALEQATDEVGYESQYRSKLLFWPIEEKDLVFKNISKIDQGIIHPKN